jgi:hypothetical protein
LIGAAQSFVFIGYSPPKRDVGAMTTEHDPLLVCPICIAEMRLIGIEPHGTTHELYTFECPKCARLEARTALLR